MVDISQMENANWHQFPLLTCKTRTLKNKSTLITGVLLGIPYILKAQQKEG